MAKRLCFFITDNKLEEKYVEFDYVKGMAFSQKVKCARSLQDAIIAHYPERKPIEISTKSSNPLGKRLSAFNLKIGGIFVESVFQSSKVFEGDIQFPFLIDSQPLEAKKYIRENGKGGLICFRYKGIEYPLTPKSGFYDWIYIQALANSDDAKDILNYDVFTDIEFNDKVSINCQARAVALFVFMNKVRKVGHYLSSFENFKKIYEDCGLAQLSLF